MSVCVSSLYRDREKYSLFWSPEKSKRLQNKATNTQFKTTTTTTKLPNTLLLSLSEIPRLWFLIKFTLRVGGFVFVFFFIWGKQSRKKKQCLFYFVYLFVYDEFQYGVV